MAKPRSKPTPKKAEPKKTDELNARQRAFVAEYLKDHNGSQAAIRAGYAPKNADVCASKLLVNPKVSEALQAALVAQEARTLVTADYVITGLREVAERCMTREPVLIREGREVKQEEAQIPCDCEDPNCKGTRTVGVWKFDSAGANRALELLGKYKKLFTDKVDVTSNGQTVKGLLLDEKKEA